MRVSPRRDRAVERRWPGLITYADPRSRIRLALAFQPLTLLLVLMGRPWSFGAAGPIGATAGLLIGYLAKVDQAAKQRD